MNPQQGPRMAQWLESAWLARYLDRQLSAEESGWFEAYVLDKPDLLASIDADNRLRDAVAASMHEEVAAVRATPAEGTQPSRRRSHTQGRWLAAAAAVVVAIGGGWLGRGAFDRDSNPDVIANPALYVGAVRGVTGPKVGAGDSPYVLIEHAIPDGATDVALTVEGAAPVPLKPEDSVVRALVRRTAMRAPNRVVLEYRINGVLEREDFALEGNR